MSDGTGSLYKRGETWWIDYSFRGERHRESSGSTRKKDATKLLQKRMKEMAGGGSKVDEEQVTLDDLATIITDDYKAKGQASISNLRTALKHLKGFFGEKSRAVDIRKDRITAYVRAKQEEGYSNGYIRRHLAVLKRAFNLAVEAERLSRVPPFPTVQVDNVRTEFLTMEDVDAVCGHLNEHLAPVVRFASLTGWRKSEILNLRWRQVDFDAGTVHLDPGTTKNREGRTFPFASLPPLEELLRRQRERTDDVERAQGRVVTHVFHRDGDRIRAMRKAWNKAAKRAGLEGAWFHDLRRTAVRNLERATVPRSVATKLTGHKTEAVYRRYAIADEAALEEGVQKLARLHEAGGESDEGRTAIPLDEARETGS